VDLGVVGTGRRVTRASDNLAFPYAELDALLRGPGREDGVGLSAIDGLVAALVAGPSFVHPDDWVPLIFAGRRPALDAGSLEYRIVKTVFHRYNEVSEMLADRPDAYRPIFRTDNTGKVVVASDWVAGFILGLGLRRAEWEKRILLTRHRALLTPILVYSPASTDFLPEISTSEKRSRQTVAYEQIAGAVIAVRAICNPHRAAEAHYEPSKTRRRRRKSR
jgi:yecA family protein